MSIFHNYKKNQTESGDPSVLMRQGGRSYDDATVTTAGALAKVASVAKQGKLVHETMLAHRKAPTASQAPTPGSPSGPSADSDAGPSSGPSSST